MDQNLKKKIVIVKGFIQKKQYKQALDQLQVLMYKYQKAYQVHLMSGLCYEKLDKLQDAQKCYKQVVELKEDEPNAIKALCEIYTKKNDLKNATIYLQKNVEILKKVDQTKYRQAIVKLVSIYRKDQVLEKIYNIFTEYCEKQNQIGEDFVQIADAYFHVSINCKSFNLQQFQLMGMKGEQTRPLSMSARQKLNNLLIEIIDYLKAVSKQYNLTQKDIANSLYEMKCYFPQAPSILMLMLIDEYCVAHVEFSTIILQQIYKLLCAYYNKQQGNSYLNLEYTQPEIFTVCMVLAYEYLAFFQEFFTLDPSLQQFIEKLASQQQTLLHTYKIRQDYNKKINNFILKNCRYLSKASQTQNLQQQIQNMKKRIQLLDNSFLQQVIAKIGMNCFVNYQKLNDMKNMLKTRINNLQQGDMVPHLYKYYLDYLMKIGKIYKILDQEINVYDVIEYINKYDPTDVKYLIEGYWLAFSKAMTLESNQQRIQITKKQIQNIQKVLDQTGGTLKSDSLRKLSVMKIFVGDYDIQQLMKQALLIDRSFANLQTMAVYLFHIKRYQQALAFLKQAFMLNQTHYHTNRLVFILLFKLNCHNEAIDFAERIKQGFRNVFWVNYVLGLKYTNLKKYTQAEQYMNSAIESFTAGCQQQYKLSYEKTQQHEQFAFLYMIEQNKIAILFDQLILPENVLYQHLQMTSSLHFRLETKRTQIKLYTQMAQVLKIVGRTKSALNYLSDAFEISQSLTQQQRSMNNSNQRFEIILLQKQYATLLFYMKMYRQCEIVIVSVYNLCKQQLSTQITHNQQKTQNNNKLILLQNIQSQIDSLSFQVAVQRLSYMLRFQSYETVQQYLNHFNIQQPKRPSINFYKGKYQFFILQYLHKRDNNITKIQSSIIEFLRYFNLPTSLLSLLPSSQQIASKTQQQFQNRFYQLDNDKKQMIKQSLQDYFVIKYISSPQSIKPQQIMKLIQLFPRSTVFYIIYGMSTTDIKMKTAAFLKCIQLDKQSPISIDLLASLYLKQKNYLAAAKLFLKSLQINILSSKCYLGLSICLFCIIGNNISTKDTDIINIIHKSIIRINSYMEYLRTVDPSENYHLLKFLKLLITDEQISNFEIKTILQLSKKTTKYKYRDSLIYQLLQQATKQWKQYNIWQHQGQIRIIQQFLSKFGESNNLLKQNIKGNNLLIAKAIIKSIKQQQLGAIISSSSLSISSQSSSSTTNNINNTKNRSQFAVKQIQRILNQLCISINLVLKSLSSSLSSPSTGTKQQHDQQYLQQVINILHQLQSQYNLMIKYSQQNQLLIRKIKSYLFQYTIITSKYQHKKQSIKSIFKDIYCYDHFIKYSSQITNIQKELFRQVLLNPDNQQLKKILSNFMVLQGKKIIKPKCDYKVELINNTHDNLLIKKQTLKKLCLLYRDDQSYVAYVSMSWQQPNSRTKQHLQKYLSILKKIQSNLQIKRVQWNNDKNNNNNNNTQTTKTNNTFNQLQALKTEIYSYYIHTYGQTQNIKKLNLNLTVSENIHSQTLLTIGKFYHSPSTEHLHALKKLIKQSLNHHQSTNLHFSILQLLQFVINKYQYNNKIQELLASTIQNISNQQQQPLKPFRSHLLLLRFLYILHKPITTEQQLIQQILLMEIIINDCQQSGVSQNTLVILKCSKCLFSADYENLAVELSIAANKKIVTYSDQLLINFFEIMRLYKQVEINPNKQGVIEEFAIYIEQMILLVKDPFYQGFFISLKAMVNAIIVPDQSISHDRNLRLALLLSPHGTKPFVKVQNI